MCSETQSLTVLPSELAKKEATCSRHWSSAARQWQQASELFRRMPSQGVRRYAITCSAAIKACEKGGEWQQSVNYSKECWAKVCNQNTITCMSSDSRSIVVIRPVVVIEVSRKKL